MEIPLIETCGVADSTVKTAWTDQRLNRLLDRYRRRFFPELPAGIDITTCWSPTLAVYDRTARRIIVNTAALETDRAVRDALLHGLCHLFDHRTGGRGHGRLFFEGLMRVLVAGGSLHVPCPEDLRA